MVTILKKILAGVDLVFLSLKFVVSNIKLIVFSAPSTLWSFFAAPVLFGLVTRYNYLNLPGYVYVFMFSFIGLIIFNFIYLGLSYFQLFSLEQSTVSLLRCARLSWGKIYQVIGWAFFSALIGTSFFHTSSTVATKTDMLSYVFFEALELFWWLINFLIIPVLTGNHTLAYAASWVIKAIASEPVIVVTAGGGLLLFKYFITRVLFYHVIMYTPFLLTSLNLVAFNQADRMFLLYILLPIIVILSATAVSVILSAVEASIATTLYARFIGKAPELDRSNFWGLFFVAVLVFIILVILAFSIATSVILLAQKVPALKTMILGFLS